MKIAYLMLFHRDPVLLKRTIAMLSTDNCAFYIHIDRKSDIRPFSSIRGDNIIFSEPRIPVYWSEFSQIEATMLLIREALVSRANYDYCVFLQGSTYPLRSGPYIERFLEEHRGSEFMNVVEMPAPGYPLSKITTVRFPSDKPIRRFVMRVFAKLGLAHRDYQKHLGELKPFSGHACWALTRAACQHFVNFMSSNPRIEAYFRTAFVPEESFLHTILGNSPFRSRVRKNFVYTDWSTSEGHHPLPLTEKHVRFFEESDKVWIDDEWGPGEMLFARKFSDDRLDLLDRVEEIIRRKERVAAGGRESLGSSCDK